MNRIKDARIRVGLSQAEVAEKLEVTQATVSNWERGRGGPSAEEQMELERVLGIGPGDDEVSDVSPLASWLTKQRTAKGMSVPELAHAAGLTPPAIYRIEAGITRNLREATKGKLETALGTKIPIDTAKELEDDAEIEGLGKLEDFDPHDEADRPEEAGVYVLYDISQRPIYVGEGGNIKSRIDEHEEKFWFKRPIVEYASAIPIDDSTLRKQIETLLIKFLKSNAVLNKKNVVRSMPERESLARGRQRRQ